MLYLRYEELGNVQWQTLLSLVAILTHYGMWGCTLGSLEASEKMTTSSRKQQRKKANRRTENDTQFNTFE